MLTSLYIHRIRLGISLFLFLAASLGNVWAQTTDARAVAIEANTANGAIDGYVTYYLETSDPLSLDAISAPPLRDEFRTLETSAADFGYYEKGIWLKVPVRNISGQEQERLLVLHTNFMPAMRVYWVAGGDARTILDQDIHSKFNSRPIPYHQLVAPITFAAGQEGDIFIRYTSEGNTVLPISLETPLSFAQTTNSRVTVDFVFYGVMMMFVAASVIGRLFWKNPTFIAYSFYAASVLLYIFQRDGYAFQYLWPNAPEWNTFSSLPIGASLSIFAAIFTRAYLNTKRMHPIMDKLLAGVAIMQLAVVASVLVIGPSDAKKIAVMTTSLSITVFVGIGIAAYRRYGRRTLFFLIGWSGILCASFVMTAVHWVNMDISRAQSLDVMRTAMVFDALMMGLASVFSIVEIQRDREKFNQERIEALNANLELHNRFGRLEQKYHLAQTLAETNSQLLVDTTHDLRQPIYALRAAMAEAGSDKTSSAARIAEVEQSLNYIEELVEATLDKALEEDEAQKGTSPDKQDVMDVGKLFSALETMFASDAAENSVELNILPSTRKVRIQPFPALRIMTNFVSNAIRYCPGSRVLVGVRRKDGALSLEVHDTGPGMTAEELSAVKQRRARGNGAKESDAGKGVGLSIVSSLAQEHGLEWVLDSRKGHGTVAKLIVPEAGALRSAGQG